MKVTWRLNCSHANSDPVTIAPCARSVRAEVPRGSACAGSLLRRDNPPSSARSSARPSSVAGADLAERPLRRPSVARRKGAPRRRTGRATKRHGHGWLYVRDRVATELPMKFHEQQATQFLASPSGSGRIFTRSTSPRPSSLVKFALLPTSGRSAILTTGALLVMNAASTRCRSFEKPA